MKFVTKFRFPVKDSDFKSYSNPGGIISTCVTFAVMPEGVAVRDSKDPSGATQFYTHDEWKAFTDGIRSEK